ncbi:MAG: hypothetical protein ABI606_12500 [Rhodoferax sp.]
MSDKMRAAQYRQRRYEAASMAHEQLTTTSTPVLLAGLARQLKAIDGTNEDARYLAATIIIELCDRHKIVLT